MAIDFVSVLQEVEDIFNSGLLNNIADIMFNDDRKIKTTVANAIEAQILKVLINRYPERNLYHPSDSSNKGDIRSKDGKTNIEIKCATLWRDAKSFTWSNGPINDKFKKLTFIFIGYSIDFDNMKINIDRVYKGYDNYLTWNEKPKNKHLTINENSFYFKHKYKLIKNI